MNARAAAAGGPTLQLGIGLAMALLAALVSAAGPSHGFAAWGGGLPVARQGVVALVIAGLGLMSASGLATLVQAPDGRTLLRGAFPLSWQTLRCTPSGALVVALAAGVGEELLFRAALQPALGALPALLLFTLAHVGTARRTGSLTRAAAYLVHVSVAGLLLAAVFQGWGLLPAIALHVAIDAVALTALGMLASLDALPAGALRQ